MTTDPLLALGEHPFLLVLEQLAPTQLCTLQRVSRAWYAFLSDHTALWSGVLRRAGVDLDEWRQTLFESGERERLKAWAEDKRQALLDEAIQQLGDVKVPTILPEEQDADEEPVIVGLDYDYDYMPEPKPEVFLPQRYPTKAAQYRAAYNSHLQLVDAWDKRYCYETLVNTPAFRLRRLYVDGPFLFAFSKAWLGAEPEDREATEDLHVLDKYSGKCLLTVPGFTRHQAHAVGAGYVLTNANEQVSEDDYEDRERDTPPGPVGRVSAFRTRAAHDRASELAELHDRPRPREYRTDLPLEFVAHVDALGDCVAFAVKLVGGEAVVCGVSLREVVLVWLENDLRVERWLHHIAVQPNDRGPRGELRSVELDERNVVVVTDLQAHVFTRTGVPVVSFPDLDSSVKLGGLVAHITWPWPYDLAVGRKPPKVTPYERVPQPPPEFHPAETHQLCFVAYRPESRKYTEMSTQITRNGDGGKTYLAAKFRGAIMDKEDLVIWAASGLLLVVQSYRELFRELVNVDEEARNEQLAERTVALVVPDGVDCLVARNRRILGARASGTMWSLDLAILPQLPATLEPLPPPDLGPPGSVRSPLLDDTANHAVWAGSFTNYDISCMSGMASRASVALDARAAYMLDWDKGFPGGTSIEYELLFEDELEGRWPWPTRPAFGHVKAWVYRAHASLLWTEHSRCMGNAMGGEGLCGCGRRHGIDDGWGSEDDGSDNGSDGEDGGGEEDAEGVQGVDEHDILGMAMADEDGGGDEPDALDVIAEALMSLGSEGPPAASGD